MVICLINIGNNRDAPSSINTINLILVTLTRDHTIYILYCRCQNVMSAKKQHLIDPAINQGKWYEMKQSAKRQKLTVDASTSSLPPPAPDSGWKTFPDADIPKMFNEGHIYHHLVESLQGPAVDESDEDDSAPHLDSHTSKPLRRGKQFFESGHVTCMSDNRTSAHYYVKAKVLASMKQISYNVQLTVSVYSRFVLNASCECKSSALGRCSHVGGLLVAMNDYLLTFGQGKACTSKPCEWNVGKKTGKNPTKITDVAYQ